MTLNDFLGEYSSIEALLTVTGLVILILNCLEYMAERYVARLKAKALERYIQGYRPDDPEAVAHLARRASQTDEAA